MFFDCPSKIWYFLLPGKLAKRVTGLIVPGSLSYPDYIYWFLLSSSWPGGMKEATFFNLLFNVIVPYSLYWNCSRNRSELCRQHLWTVTTLTNFPLQEDCKNFTQAFNHVYPEAWWPRYWHWWENFWQWSLEYFLIVNRPSYADCMLDIIRNCCRRCWCKNLYSIASDPTIWCWRHLNDWSISLWLHIFVSYDTNMRRRPACFKWFSLQYPIIMGLGDILSTWTIFKE